MAQFEETDEYKNLCRALAAPFILEYQGNFEKALEAHIRAVADLKDVVEHARKNLRKLYRKMFERQLQVHEERIAYLRRLSREAAFKDVVIPPTFLGAEEELEVEAGFPRPLSLDQKQLWQGRGSSSGAATTTDSNEKPRPWSASLDASLPPVKYRISHSSELVSVGARSHWMFVKDETNTHTFWAMQTVWSNEVPITGAVLRRAGEFIPGAGAIQVAIRKTRGGSFNLEMESLTTGKTTEMPDRGEHTKDWSPRRFEYGGRQFVWKDEGTAKFGKSPWETLYETKRVWPKEGSKTGKKEDETEGRKLFWGVSHGGLHADHTLYFAAGMDQGFREHLLASQLARYFRRNYPPNKDVKGVEAVAASAGVLSLASGIQGLLS
ncbi:MAG: hypothetical protein Q9211_001280 [Gyalolechia sp. 1 TL-2023]